MSRKQTRSEARECAFSLVFQFGAGVGDTEFLIEQLTEEKPECVDNLAYIRAAAEGVAANTEEIDRKIAQALPANRGITRLSKVVTAILRLAVYEMLYIEDVPDKVAINEAVELAKKFGEEDAPKFVNGVLSGVISK